MPRIRDRKQQNQSISVTPWMSKKGSIEGATAANGNTGTPHQLLYSVVLADAHPAPPEPTPCTGFAQPPPLAADNPTSVASLPAFGCGDGWHSARRGPSRGHQLYQDNSTPADSSDQHQQRTALHTSTAKDVTALSDPFELSSDSEAVSEEHEQQQQQDYATVPSNQQQHSLHGIAQLVLLPSGTIAGHFIAQSSSAGQQQQQQQQQQLLKPPICLGLHGKQVLGIHSCYRDPEWALLQMTVIKYSSDSKSSSSSNSSSSSRGQKGSKPTSSNISKGTAAADEAEPTASAGKQQQASNSDSERQVSQRQHRQHWDNSIEGSIAKRHCRREQEQQKQQAREVDVPATAAAVAAEHDPMASMSEDETAVTTGNSCDSAAAAAVFGTINDISSSSSSTAAESVAWVQRTGGDLVTLSPADIDDEDTSAVVLQDSLGLDPDFVCVEFKGRTLLAGAAADEQLRRTWPQLVGQEGLVVNVGRMMISNLPDGWVE